MLKIKLNHFRGPQDTRPTMSEPGWDALLKQYLHRHALRDDEAGPMISGCLYGKHTKTSKPPVTEISMAILHLENADPEKVRQTLTECGVKSVLVRAHSHTPESPSFSAVIPFTAPLQAAHWPWLVAQFDDMLGSGITANTKALSQALSLPSCPEANQGNAFNWAIPGDVFDPEAMLATLGSGHVQDDGDEDQPDHGQAGSGGKPCPRQLAVDAIRYLFGGLLRYYNHEFYAYGNGYWRVQNRAVDMEQRMLRHYKTLPYGFIKQVIETMQAMTVVTDIAPATGEAGRLLCLNNGTLELMTGELLDHSPHHNLINHMAVDWDPAKTAPIFSKALDDIFAYDADAPVRIDFIQELYGYCLIPDTSQHKFFWLVGTGGNGKSVLLNTLAALAGQANVSYAMLERMGKPSVRAELQGKLVNISHEMGTDATIADGYLKAIVAGDWVEAERKFQPSFSFQPFVRIVAATNSLPYLKDTTDGFFRRAIILPLTRKFDESEMDKRLQDKIMKELGGILVWAVEGLRRLLKRDAFIIPESAVQMANAYRDESDSVRYFIKEACAADKKGTKPSVLYEQYQRYAAACRLPQLNLIKFGKKLTALGIDSRYSNGEKFWLLVMTEMQPQRSTRQSISEDLGDD
jgi:P4 family phage/plasmid primase-like protien